MNSLYFQIHYVISFYFETLCLFLFFKVSSLDFLNQEVQVNFMKGDDDKGYIFPQIEDSSWVSLDDLKIMPFPEFKSDRRFHFN